MEVTGEKGEIYPGPRGNHIRRRGGGLIVERSWEEKEYKLLRRKGRDMVS